VFRVSFEPVKSNPEPVVQQPGIQSQVQGSDILPGNGGRHRVGRAYVVNAGSVTPDPGSQTGSHGGNIQTIGHGLIADGPPGAPEFKEAEDWLGSGHEILFGQYPSGRKGGEPPPFQIGGKFRGTVVT